MRPAGTLVVRRATAEELQAHAGDAQAARQEERRQDRLARSSSPRPRPPRPRHEPHARAVVRARLSSDRSPGWYKLTIVGFLLLNPIVLLLAGPTVAGWLLLGEFIFTLAMALRCYPLQPGGLLAIEAVIIGLTTPESVYEEVPAPSR